VRVPQRVPELLCSAVQSAAGLHLRAACLQREQSPTSAWTAVVAVHSTAVPVTPAVGTGQLSPNSMHGDMVRVSAVQAAWSARRGAAPGTTAGAPCTATPAVACSGAMLAYLGQQQGHQR
jgi:hypothetical protein